jgi:spermidine synthase
VRYRGRSFFGTLRVEDHDGVRSLVHGTIIHGQQSLDPALRRQPIAYYHPSGPIGDVFAEVHARWPAVRVGVLGLGAGTLAAYGRAGDSFVFYEIDAAVDRVARDERLFTWLADSPAESLTVLGDARLTIAGAAPGAYQLIMADAFSSHAIPMHLVTREALALYLDRLAPGGLVVFNISSPYIDLTGPLGALAREAGLVGVMRRDREPPTPLKVPSSWVVLARARADLGRLTAWESLPPGGRAWTDDFSDLLGALRF